MADAGRKPKLGDMTSGNLPANRSGRPPANREDAQVVNVPEEHRARETRGRSPEDVVAERPVAQPPQQRTAEADDEQPKQAAKKVKVRGQELTLAELAQRPDLLEALATTAEKYPELQAKHQQTLEKLADRAFAKPEPEKAKELTPDQRWFNYQQLTLQTLDQWKPFAEKVIEFLVKAGKIEADAPEAYKELLISQVADSCAKNYRISVLEDTVAQLKDWVHAEVGIRDARTVEYRLQSAIDAVAAKADDENHGDDVRLYRPLKNKEARAAFVKWLKEEIDPKVGAIDPENMDRFWKAYIVTSANDLLKSDRDDSREASPTDRRQARGEGRGSRVGSPDGPEEKTQLSRLIDHARPGLFQR